MAPNLGIRLNYLSRFFKPKNICKKSASTNQNCVPLDKQLIGYTQ